MRRADAAQIDPAAGERQDDERYRGDIHQQGAESPENPPAVQVQDHPLQRQARGEGFPGSLGFVTGQWHGNRPFCVMAGMVFPCQAIPAGINASMSLDQQILMVMPDSLDRSFREG